jgi:hypothetical protein
VDVALTLDPARGTFRHEGAGSRSSTRNDAPLDRFALTGGFHWTDVRMDD